MESEAYYNCKDGHLDLDGDANEVLQRRSKSWLILLAHSAHPCTQSYGKGSKIHYDGDDR